MNSLYSISIVHSSGLPQVADQMFTSVSSSISVECLPSQSRSDLVHLLVLESLPQIVRDVEHDSLEEQHEWNPLIIGMTLYIILITSLWTHTLMRSVNSINTSIFG